MCHPPQRLSPRCTAREAATRREAAAQGTTRTKGVAACVLLRVLLRALVRAACAACASTRAVFLVPPNSWQPRDTTSACTCSTCTPDMIQTSKRYSVPTCSRTPCVESAHAWGRARACKIEHPINELERSNTYAGTGGHHLRRCWRTSSTPTSTARTRGMY